MTACEREVDELLHILQLVWNEADRARHSVIPNDTALTMIINIVQSYVKEEHP